ncbi:hypothetical protein MMC30_004652 [Trapelia coarctata]|nr:hypothetical protein [Trapelia coarctata]
MSGLVGYGSSDEEGENGEAVVAEVKTSNLPQSASSAPAAVDSALVNGRSATGKDAPTTEAATAHPNSDRPSIGPSIGPSGMSLDDDTNSAPQSPYIANRAMVRDLTLPTIPNLDIPVSPPGSPPPGMDQKFAHFLELKKQGVHFNEKLARSSALKNPSLLKKLMDFAGVEEDQQYATTLPADIWDPTGFPAAVYKEQLASSQQEILKRREEERANAQRGAIDFVSASASNQSSRSGTPASGTNSKGFRGSAAERVMAGLDRDRVQSPRTSNLVARSTSSRGNARNEDRDSRWRARSRSPNRRKRSGSR